MVRTHIHPLSALTLVAALASGAVLPSQTRVVAAGMDAPIRSTNSAQSFTGVPIHFLAGLQLQSARAQTPLTVTLTVNLEITTPVPPTDTFSAFIGTSDKPAEVVLCGTGRGEGRITYCTAGLTITQRTPIFTAGAVPYRFVHFSGPFGTGQRGSTFARGMVMLTRDATISAAYPSAVRTVPVTFRLRLHGTVPPREYFGVDYPRGGASPEDLPLCTSEAQFIARTPGGYQHQCVGNGLYTTTVRVSIGTTIGWTFYRFWTMSGRILQSREAFAPGHLRVNRATFIDAYYTFSG